MYREHNVQKTQFSQRHPCASAPPPSRKESLLREQKWHTDAISQGRIYASKHVSDRNTDATRWHHCVCTTASHSALNSVPPVCLPPPHPISTPQRKLVHHVGFEAPWRGRVCTAALLCLVLHNMSWGIDIPQPFLSPSLPLQQWSSPATACSLFRGSKKSSRRSKNSSACTALSGSCLLACRNTWIPTRSPTTIVTTARLLLHPELSNWSPKTN